jgi:hypothetical protein
MIRHALPARAVQSSNAPLLSLGSVPCSLVLRGFISRKHFLPWPWQPARRGNDPFSRPSPHQFHHNNTIRLRKSRVADC